MRKKRITKPVESRFWSKVKILEPDDCWEWIAGMSNGYGLFWKPDGLIRAHRVAWELANGRSVPDGLLVCHSCDNKPCCNPAHLWLGTYSDNAIDMHQKRRAAQGKPHHKVAPK